MKYLSLAWPALIMLTLKFPKVKLADIKKYIIYPTGSVYMYMKAFNVKKNINYFKKCTSMSLRTKHLINLNCNTNLCFQKDLLWFKSNLTKTTILGFE